MKTFIRKVIPAIVIIGLILVALYRCTFYDSHVDAELIPMKTSFAGSDICNDGVDIQILCVELLMYDGFLVDGKAQIIEGIEGATSQYPLTEKELTVDWEGFESDIGMINYLGIVLYNPKVSVMETIVTDVCEVIAVTWEYEEWCTEEDGILSILKDMSGQEWIYGYYLPIERIDNGHIIMMTNEAFDPDAFSDARYGIAHEYFHMYQRVHSDIEEPLQTEEELEYLNNAFPTDGPMWFIEGTAEYSAEVTGREKGWGDFRGRLKSVVYEIYYMRQQEDEKYINSLSISENITPADHESLTKNEQSGSDAYYMGHLAVAYAVALSSHDSVMVDYWDDLKEYGAKESFRRNVGMSFEEFQIEFEELIQKDASEILAVINPQSAFVPEGSIYDSPEVGPVQLEPVEVDYTKSPNISNGILSLQATIQKGYSLEEIWLFYDGESQAINSEQSSNLISTCLYYSDEPSCENIDPFTIVIPNQEKEYTHDIPEFRYDMFFTLTDMWTAIDGEVYVTADISDVMQGSGIYIVVLMSGEGTLHFMGSSIFKEKMYETAQRQVSGDSAALQEFDQWMIDYELNYDIIDVHSIWVD